MDENNKTINNILNSNIELQNIMENSNTLYYSDSYFDS